MPFRQGFTEIVKFVNVFNVLFQKWYLLKTAVTQKLPISCKKNLEILWPAKRNNSCCRGLASGLRIPEQITNLTFFRLCWVLASRGGCVWGLRCPHMSGEPAAATEWSPGRALVSQYSISRSPHGHQHRDHRNYNQQFDQRKRDTMHTEAWFNHPTPCIVRVQESRAAHHLHLLNPLMDLAIPVGTGISHIHCIEILLHASSPMIPESHLAFNNFEGWFNQPCRTKHRKIQAFALRTSFSLLSWHITTIEGRNIPSALPAHLPGLPSRGD